MNSLPEAELVARCRRGEAAAWDEFFTRFYAPVGRFVFQLSSDFTREDADEICQEVFLSAIRGLSAFQGESQVQTWLFRIAANRARDFRDKQHAAKRGGARKPVSLQAEDPETGLTIDAPTPAPGPDDQLLRLENAALIGQALEQLGDPCREIIELRYFGDLSYGEISKTLGLNEKTVSSRLSKCLDKLEGIARVIFSGEKPGVLPSNQEV